MNLGPLQPYVWLLKAGAALAIASALFVGGCNHGKREQAADDLAEMDGLRHQLLLASTALQQAADVLHVISAETKAAEAAAQAQADQSAATVKRAQARAKSLQGQLIYAEREIERAKRDPDCRLLLETPSCAAFR